MSEFKVFRTENNVLGLDKRGRILWNQRIRKMCQNLSNMEQVHSECIQVFSHIQWSNRRIQQQNKSSEKMLIWNKKL